jgi:hypothetical protein
LFPDKNLAKRENNGCLRVSAAMETMYRSLWPLAFLSSSGFAFVASVLASSDVFLYLSRDAGVV